MSDDRTGPQGLGGWLILVGIGLCVAPLFRLVFLAQTFLPFLTQEVWADLTTPGGAAYHPMWAPVLLFEVGFNALLLLASLALLVLFFSRSRFFPTVFIATAILNLVFIPLDAWLVTFVQPDEPMFDPETAKQFGRTVTHAAIWIPYMLLSQRVKNTFVA